MTFVEFDNVKLLRQTDLAGLFEFEDGEEFWIPWSQIEENEDDVSHDGDVGTLSVAEWLAIQKGLI